jgi:hypothetical protein
MPIFKYVMYFALLGIWGAIEYSFPNRFPFWVVIVLFIALDLCFDIRSKNCDRSEVPDK